MNDIPTRLSEALSGRYALERPLGEGGMATVYLAEDRKHSRQVAIKVLKPELAAVVGAERFLAEIETTANLQHPHILPLFDSGEAEGFLYYVMPYVEGESLQEKLDREKQLPVDEAIGIAIKVAGALQAAHDRSVVHRDIKPANILMQDGEPLVADFGIALAVQEAGGGRLTETGLSLGTPYYMSPEQAMADRDPDARSDLYSLACVLYEMLSGDPPHTASTAQAVVAKILTQDPPPISESRRTVPGHVEAALSKALERLPADRFVRAADFAAALEGKLEVAPAGGKTGRGARDDGVALWRWKGIATLAVVAALWGWLGRAPAVPPSPPSHLAVPVPNLGSAVNSSVRQLALSPDGSTLLFSGPGMQDSEYGTHRRDLADLRTRTLESTTPFLGSYVFSADGSEFLAMDAGSRLYRYSIDGTNERPLSSEISNPWFDWTEDGAIWFSGDGRNPGLQRLEPSGEVVRPFEGRYAGHLLQQVVPDTRIALLVRPPPGSASGPLVAVDLDSGESHTVLSTDVAAARVTAGYLVTVLPNGVLRANAYDPGRAEILGPSVQLAEGVLVDQAIAHMSVSANGSVAYIPEAPRDLVFVERDGRSRRASVENRNFHAPVFSPDGERVAVDFDSDAGRNVWTLSVAEGVPSRATFVPDGHDARWSPEGDFITHLARSQEGGQETIFRTRPGNVESDSLIGAPTISYTGEWIPDGSAIVSVGQGLEPGSGSDLILIRNGGRGPVEPLVVTRFEELWPAVSPDGRWLAYGSNRSGRYEIYLQALDGRGSQIQVSLSGGTEPLWGSDRNELFYRAGPGAGTELVAATLRFDPELAVVSRETLFSVRDILPTIPHTNYDVSPDGGTFVMVRFNPSSRIMVIQNLPALIRGSSGLQR